MLKNMTNIMQGWIFIVQSYFNFHPFSQSLNGKIRVGPFTISIISRHVWAWKSHYNTPGFGFKLPTPRHHRLFPVMWRFSNFLNQVEAITWPKRKGTSTFVSLGFQLLVFQRVVGGHLHPSFFSLGFWPISEASNRSNFGSEHVLIFRF